MSFPFKIKNEVIEMFNFFNSKRNRVIAGVIVIVLVASMVVTTILSVMI